MMETLLKDIRYGVRNLLKHPGFTAIAVITLALGIGANTAIFSVVNAVLLRALPFPNADRLVMVWEDASYAGFPRNTPALGRPFLAEEDKPEVNKVVIINHSLWQQRYGGDRTMIGRELLLNGEK